VIRDAPAVIRDAPAVIRYAIAVIRYATALVRYATALIRYATAVVRYATAVIRYATAVDRYATAVDRYAEPEERSAGESQEARVASRCVGMSHLTSDSQCRTPAIKANTERQRRFRERNPGYYGRLHRKRRAATKARLALAEMARAEAKAKISVLAKPQLCLPAPTQDLVSEQIFADLARLKAERELVGWASAHHPAEIPEPDGGLKPTLR
jgi:hypothetical protein